MRSRHRTFQLLDAILIIAALAVGLAMARAYDHFADFHLISPMSPPSPEVFRRSELVPWDYLVFGEQIVGPAVLVWTLAFVVLRLRQPRPRLRRLFRQPGMAGCATVLTVMPIFLFWKILGQMVWASGEFEGQGVGYWFPEAFKESLFWVGSSVVAVWLNLALSRRCAAEPSWIDRLGRVLACYWIVVPILSMAG